MKLKTDYWAKPGPDRQFDWSVIDDDTYDGPGSTIGYGATEEAAIKDFMEQIDERINLWDLCENGAEYQNWCGKYGLHFCFECGESYDLSYGNLDKECPDHMKCMRCRY